MIRVSMATGIDPMVYVKIPLKALWSKVAGIVEETTRDVRERSLSS